MNDKVTFRSQVNGIQFDSVNGTTNSLLASHKKSDFVRPESKVKNAGKAKVSVKAADDNEQEIS